MMEQRGILFTGKKSFTLFSTLLLVFIFSILIIKIYETKTISSINILNQYKYIQAKNHLLFLEEYIKALDNLKALDKIKIEDINYEIFAQIEETNTKYDVELVVKAKDSSVRVYKRVEVTK